MASVPDDWNPFGYIPNSAANTAVCVLFFVILVVQLVLGSKTREWWLLFTWGITAALEFIGYVCRALSHRYPVTHQLFKLQLICCLIAPTFMSAGLYYQLGKEITIYGEHYSKTKIQRSVIFCTAGDLTVLILQAIGGGLTVANALDTHLRNIGGWFMVGGIGLQVEILLLFLINFAVINCKIFKDDPRNWSSEFAHTRQRSLYPYLLPALSLVFLMTRSAYRIAELSMGLTGYLMNTERYFFIFDGLMIVLATIPLCIIHTGLAYGHVRIRKPEYRSIESNANTADCEDYDENVNLLELNMRSSSETVRSM